MPVAPKGGNLSQISHELTGPAWTLASTPDTGQALTCGYGLRRTGRTHGTDLRVRWPLGDGGKLLPRRFRSSGPKALRSGSACHRRQSGSRRRARGVPDRTVISGESRSLTDTPCRHSPGAGQVRRPRPRSLQAGGQGFESPNLSSTRQNTILTHSRQEPGRSRRESPPTGCPPSTSAAHQGRIRASSGQDLMSPVLLRSDVPSTDLDGAGPAPCAFRHGEQAHESDYP